MNAFNDQEKQNPELNRHFQMYQSQLNFVNFCAKNTLGISWQHLIHLNIHVCSVYAVDNTASFMYSFAKNDGFTEVKTSYIKSAHYSKCDDYGVNVNKIG